MIAGIESGLAVEMAVQNELAQLASTSDHSYLPASSHSSMPMTVF